MTSLPPATPDTDDSPAPSSPPAAPAAGDAAPPTDAMTDNAAPRGDDHAPLDIDLPCMECGYNLRGLARQRDCPECGRAIVDTLQCHHDPRWLRRVRGGLAIVIVAYAVVAILAVLAAIVTTTMPRHYETLAAFMALATYASMVVFLVGGIVITMREPGYIVNRAGNRMRLILRILVGCAAGLLIIGSPALLDVLSPVGGPALPISSASLILGHLFLIAVWVATLGYLSRLAERVELPRHARAFMFLVISYGLLGGAVGALSMDYPAFTLVLASMVLIATVASQVHLHISISRILQHRRRYQPEEIG